MLWLLIEVSRYFNAYIFYWYELSIQMKIVLILNITALVFNALDHYCSKQNSKVASIIKTDFAEMMERKLYKIC